MKKGKITFVYEKHSGSDIDVVNMARGSFAKKKKDGEDLTKGDISLINYLARGYTNTDWHTIIDSIVHSKDPIGIETALKNIARAPTHFAPFTHQHMTGFLCVPIFLARQLVKHQIGLAWSEESRRYIDHEPEFWFPEEGYPKRAKDIKQGSADETVDYLPDGTFDKSNMVRSVSALVEENTTNSVDLYMRMLENEVSPEIARMVLPQNMMINYHWTGSLMAWARVYNLRTGHGAQGVHGELMPLIHETMSKYYSHSWEALTQ
jgi:thymidylate synthase (FAD)